MDLQTSIGNTSQAFKSVFQEMSDEMQMCIQNCMSCHQICVLTLSHCIEKGGSHSEAAHLKSLMDCAQICTVSADFMSRQSDIHASVCGACAEACLTCAQSCERFEDDAVMKACADLCRQCAESCKKMAAQH